jgi:hypothetical protein
MKEVITAVIASLATALILWLVGFFKTSIPDLVSIPSGAVVAFDSKECPSNGWREFKAGYGRFIRGIDKGSNPIDPDGLRTPGALQSDSFQKHDHTGDYQYFKPAGRGTGDPENLMISTGQGTRKFSVFPDGDVETRPKNVALLFCQKL